MSWILHAIFPPSPELASYDLDAYTILVRASARESAKRGTDTPQGPYPLPAPTPRVSQKGQIPEAGAIQGRRKAALPWTKPPRQPHLLCRMLTFPAAKTALFDLLALAELISERNPVYGVPGSSSIFFAAAIYDALEKLFDGQSEDNPGCEASLSMAKAKSRTSSARSRSRDTNLEIWYIFVFSTASRPANTK
ncbi:hypothetical protein B0H13DRAFT_1912704 [Mycena leptocephala]|nr:hypothetical protein B0H13DRAFT_1912704 [Mycena leptocephala]